MGIIAKAMELGREIADSNELKSFREAEKAVMSNPQAYDLVRRFMAEQQTVRQAHMSGNVTSEQRDGIRTLHRELMENQVAKEYLETQQRFDQVIGQINQILQQAISGNTCSTGGG